MRIRISVGGALAQPTLGRIYNLQLIKFGNELGTGIDVEICYFSDCHTYRGIFVSLFELKEER